MTRKIAVIGGGPAGLYAARLLKQADPSLQVVVHERMDGAAQTFGFGVGLTESTMRNLLAADPETAERIRAASHVGHELQLKGSDGTVPLHGARNLAIGRAALLDILTEAATAVQVEIRRGAHADVASVDADVVIAADGVGSATREKFAADLGVRTSLGRTRFVWCGADFAVDSAFFCAVEQGESLFVAHAYPYAADRSTFLLEADETTWRSAGLGELDRQVPAGQTDQASVALLQEAFARELRGRPLLTNRTRWSRFTNLTLDRWWVENVVLLGDAAHTAHYTLGSGTKLAMEDAIALAQALAGEGSIGAAFAAYEDARRPAVERFKKLAHRSQAWWDSYRARHHWPIDRLALSYMTRSGNITLQHYLADQPEAARRALSRLGDDVPADPAVIDDWVLGRPLDGGSRWRPRAELSPRTVLVSWTEPDVWGPAADEAVRRLAAQDSAPILLTGDSGQDVPARIDLAERLRLELDREIGVELPAQDRSVAATAIAAGRADFVVPAG